MAIFHIFVYLKKHKIGAQIVFDPKTPIIDERVFWPDDDWSDFYRDVCKEIPPNMPDEPKGRCVNTSCFVDANHASNVEGSCIRGLSCLMFRMLRFSGFPNNKKLLNPHVLVADLSPYKQQRVWSWLWGKNSAACSVFPSMDRQTSFVIVLASQRIQQPQNPCWWRSTTLFRSIGSRPATCTLLT